VTFVQGRAPEQPQTLWKRSITIGLWWHKYAMLHSRFKFEFV